MWTWIAENPKVVAAVVGVIVALGGLSTVSLLKYLRMARDVINAIMVRLEVGKNIGSTAEEVKDTIKEKMVDMAVSRVDFLKARVDEVDNKKTPEHKGKRFLRFLGKLATLR